MSTLGQKPATRHVSTEKQTITGNGGTSYTLQQSVSQAADIEVYVNNTRQEPAVAYNASGTTLTMTGAVNSSDSFYVIFQGKAIQTAGLPVDAAITASTLSVTGATTLTGGISGTLGVGTASPDGTLHVHSASAGSVTPQTAADDLVVENNGHGGMSILTPDANRSAIVFGHASDNHKMQIRHDGGTSISQIISDDALTFNVGDGTERMRIDANGHITKPTQSAFGAHGSGTSTLPINVYTHIPVTVERFDQNGDFDTSTKTFTAPVTGRYQLNTGIYLYNYLDNEAGYLYFAIVTSNETYDFPTQSSIFGSDIGTFTLQGSALADMDAGDTAYVHIYQQGGTAQATISHGHTFFNGALIC